MSSMLKRILNNDEPSLGPPSKGAGRVVRTILLAVAAIVIVSSAVYTVDTGNVAVEKTLGTVNLEEIQPA